MSCHVKALLRAENLCRTEDACLLMYPVNAHSWDQYNYTEKLTPTLRHTHNHLRGYAVRVHLGGGDAFQHLKDAFCTNEVLAHFDPSQDFMQSSKRWSWSSSLFSATQTGANVQLPMLSRRCQPPSRATARFRRKLLQ